MKILKAVLGFCVAIIVGAVIASTVVGQATPKLPPVATTVSGRYQIVINPNIRADTFLLDTQSGKVWIPVVCSNCNGEPSRWMYMDRVDNEKESDSWIDKQKFHNPETK
jgi:hypothetical protein